MGLLQRTLDHNSLFPLLLDSISLSQVPPPDPNQPRIISSFITLESESKICKQAYAPGEHFTVPAEPNITAVNALGGYDIAADRLAIIDGEGEDSHASVSLRSADHLRSRPMAPRHASFLGREASRRYDRQAFQADSRYVYTSKCIGF